MDQPSLYLSFRGLSPSPERLLHIIENITLKEGSRIFLDWGESFPWSFECGVPEIYRYDESIICTIFRRIIERDCIPVMVIPLAGFMPEITSFHLYKAVRDHSQFDISALGHKKIIEDIIDDFTALDTGCTRICLHRPGDIGIDQRLSEQVVNFVYAYQGADSLRLVDLPASDKLDRFEGTDFSGMLTICSIEEKLFDKNILSGDIFSTKAFSSVVTQLIELEQHMHLLYSSFRMSHWKRSCILKLLIKAVDEYKKLKKKLHAEVNALNASHFVNRLPLSDFIAIQLNQLKGLPFDEALIAYL